MTTSTASVVVLVDDVLFSGRTVRAALDALSRPRPAPRRTARGARRPRPPRAADPRRLRRQERADQPRARPCTCSSPRSTAATPCCSVRRTSAATAGRRDEHLLSRRRPEPRRRDADPRHRRGDGAGRRARDQEAADPARPHGREPLLRGLHPHPHQLRGRGEAALRGRDHLQRQGFQRQQGRVAQGHGADARGDGRRRRRLPAQRQRRARGTSPAGSSGHVVNAGDGTHEHPTQALLDAFTMRRRTGRLEGLRVAHRRRRPALAGRPLATCCCCTRSAREVTLVAPPTLLPLGVETWPAEVSYDLDAVLPKTDVVMMLRVQRERMGAAFFPTEREYSRRYGLDRDPDGRCCPTTRSSCIPARWSAAWRSPPRSPTRVRSTIIEQVANGVSVRMAVLYLLLGTAPRPSEPTKEALPHERRHRGCRRSSAARRPTSSSRDGVIAAIGADESAATARRSSTPTGSSCCPGLVDLHTHLREPGREDAETVAHRHPGGGARRLHRRARDGQHRPGRRHRGRRRAGLAARPRGRLLSTCTRSARSPSACAGERLAELGAMADSAARVRVFSDDGICVSDPLLMRRALEYVKAFDGVIAQHAQDPRLTEGAQMNEGDRLGAARADRLADASPRRRSSPATVCWPPTSGPACTSATSPPPVPVEIIRRGQGAGHRGHRRGHPAPPAAHRRPAPAATTRCSRSTRRCAPRPTSTRCGPGSPTARSTPSPPTTRRTPCEDKETEWAAAKPGMLGLETALVGRAGRPWDAARLGRRRRPDVGAPRPGSAASPATAADRGRRAGQPDARRPDGRADRRRRRTGEQEPQHAVRRPDPARHGRRHVPARRATVLTVARSGSSGMSAAPARPGGRPHVPRRGLRRRRRDLRRGRLRHRDDRLPGDADRPVLPPPGRRADRAAHRQHRRQRRGRRVAPKPGSPATSCATPPGSRSNWRATGDLDELARGRRASSASAASTPGPSPGTCASAAPCASASPASRPIAEALLERVLASPGWSAPSSPAEVSTTETYVVPAVGERRFTVAALDLGIKRRTPVASRPARDRDASSCRHAPPPTELLGDRRRRRLRQQRPR